MKRDRFGASKASQKKSRAPGQPPHILRQQGSDLFEYTESTAVRRWACPLRVPTCTSEDKHFAHADLKGLFQGKKHLDKSLLESVLGSVLDWRHDEEHVLLLRREDVTGVHRERLVRRAWSEQQWSAVLETYRSLDELRLLAQSPAPTCDLLELLLMELQGDRRGYVHAIFAERRHSGTSFNASAWIIQQDRTDFPKVIRRVGGEFVEVAYAILDLPCPSGRWTEGLVLGSVKKLFTRLPEGERGGAALEILVSLATNWEGSVKELLEASEALSY